MRDRGSHLVLALRGVAFGIGSARYFVHTEVGTDHFVADESPGTDRRLGGAAGVWDRAASQDWSLGSSRGEDTSFVVRCKSQVEWKIEDFSVAVQLVKSELILVVQQRVVPRSRSKMNELCDGKGSKNRLLQRCPSKLP